MESQVVKSINFTDLKDTPNTLKDRKDYLISANKEGNSLVFISDIKISSLENTGSSILKENLTVFGNCIFEKDTKCKILQSETIVGKNISCDNDLKVSGNISAQGIKTTSSETTNLKVSQTLKSEYIESSKIKSVSMDIESLSVFKNIDLPQEVNAKSLNVNSLKVLETSYLNKVLSTEQTCVSLNSASGLITDFASVNSTIVDIKATKISSDEIISASVHHKTSDIDGTADVPLIKDLDDGCFQRTIYSSKYVWYGMLKSSSKSIKIKINTQTPKVLSQVIPRVSFHIYDLRGLDLNPSFKHDSQIFINKNDDTSFFVNVNFSDNLPLISKFIFSVVLDKV